MEYNELIKERFSVRKFGDEKVSPEDIQKILEAGALAPTGCNYQPQRIYVFSSEEAIEKLKKCTKCHFGAPLGLLVCYEKEEAWRRKYDGKSSGVCDASIVATHMMLEIANLGLGATWVMHFNPEAIISEFSIPEGRAPVALLMVGHPAEDAEPLDMHYKKRDLHETVIYK